MDTRKILITLMNLSADNYKEELKRNVPGVTDEIFQQQENAILKMINSEDNQTAIFLQALINIAGNSVRRAIAKSVFASITEKAVAAQGRRNQADEILNTFHGKEQ